MIGIVQEQHPDRARLYRQWRQLDWPIYVDALNQLGHRVVPIPMAIDPNGLIVSTDRPSAAGLAAFVERDAGTTGHLQQMSPAGHRGDKLFLEGKLDEAIDAFGRSDDAHARFRLGVALRRRYESDQRKPGDAQAAIDAWTAALALQPNQYVWRRRLQQYGPLLDKPYNFYGWVEEARADIRARGEEPVPLAVEPRGSEVLDKGVAPGPPAGLPDPEGKIARDTRNLVAVETMVTPARVRPGARVRVRVTFRVATAFWNNESDPLTLFVASGPALDARGGASSHPNAKEAETQEERILEFDAEIAADAPAGEHELKAYALYNVCEAKAGVCRYLRRDLTVAVTVDPKAPSLR